MSTTPRQAAVVESAWPSVYWPIAIARSLPALALGLSITFIADHSASVGLLAFGLYALVAGVIIVVLAALRIADRSTRILFLVQGVVGILLGALALLFTSSEIGLLLFVSTVYFAITGFLELFAGLRRRGTPVAREWITVGAFSAVAALVFLALPADPVLATGLLGAYGVILGVYLVIAGLSLKWSVAPAAEQHPEDVKER